MSMTFFVLYVQDQEKSKAFYSRVLALEPSLHVPGMTRFDLTGSSSLGLMPNSGIKALLGDALPDPAAGTGIPRAELYLHVDDPELCHARACKLGAKSLSECAPRPWGDRAAYALDPDGHVLVFASPL